MTRETGKEGWCDSSGWPTTRVRTPLNQGQMGVMGFPRCLGSLGPRYSQDITGGEPLSPSRDQQLQKNPPV